MQADTGSNGDKQYHLPDDMPIITPERAAKGDVTTGPPCGDCGGSGKAKSTLSPNIPCRACRGKGWSGNVNAASVDLSDIHFAQVQVNNVMNHLWNRRVLDSQNHHDGQTYEIWQIIYNARTGFRNNPIYATEIPGMRQAVIADGLDVGSFTTLIRKLSAPQKKLIEFAIYEKATEHARWLMGRHLENFRSAFGRLTEVMQGLRDEWERERESENNACNDMQVR